MADDDTTTMSKAPSRARRARAIAEAAFLSALAFDVRARGPISSFEQASLHAPATPPSWVRTASRLAERDVLALGVLVSAVDHHRRGQPVVAPVIGVIGGVATRALAAPMLHRPRPPVSWWAEEPKGWSFPSRHTTDALLLTCELMEGRVGPRVAGAGFWTVAVVVGYSRVRLGVHWPSDIVGAALWARSWWRLAGAG